MIEYIPPKEILLMSIIFMNNYCIYKYETTQISKLFYNGGVDVFNTILFNNVLNNPQNTVFIY